MHARQYAAAAALLKLHAMPLLSGTWPSRPEKWLSSLRRICSTKFQIGLPIAHHGRLSSYAQYALVLILPPRVLRLQGDAERASQSSLSRVSNRRCTSPASLLSSAAHPTSAFSFAGAAAALVPLTILRAPAGRRRASSFLPPVEEISLPEGGRRVQRAPTLLPAPALSHQP